jgi:hypothetical protein
VTDLDILDEMVANDALGLIDDMTETDACEAVPENEEQNDVDGERVINFDIVGGADADIDREPKADTDTTETVGFEETVGAVREIDANVRVGDAMFETDAELHKVPEADNESELETDMHAETDRQEDKLAVADRDSDSEFVFDDIIVPETIDCEAVTEDVVLTETGFVGEAESEIESEAVLFIVALTDSDAHAERDRNGETLTEGDGDDEELVLLLGRVDGERNERDADELGLDDELGRTVRDRDARVVCVMTLAVPLWENDGLEVIWLGLAVDDADLPPEREPDGDLVKLGEFDEDWRGVVVGAERDLKGERETDGDDETDIVRVERIVEELKEEALLDDEGLGEFDEDIEIVDVTLSDGDTVTERVIALETVLGDTLIGPLAVVEREDDAERVTIVDVAETEKEAVLVMIE